MPKRKPYVGDEFRNIPPGPITPPEITEQFIDRLSKLQMFKRGKDGFYLRVPEYGGTVTLGEDLRQLLQPLSTILLSFFKDHRIDAESYSETLTGMTTALSDLSSSKRELLTSGIIDEKAFNKTFDRINEWRQKYSEHIFRPIPSEKKAKLIRDMVIYFRQSARKLKRDGAFYCVAYVLQSFDIEQGDIKQIFARIKKDYYRKGSHLT